MKPIDQKEELKDQAGMANVDGGAILEDMLEDISDEVVSQEVKDKNPYQFKFEVKLKKLPKKLKSVIGLEKGKVGRVIEVLDHKNVVVDFWDTRPAKFPVNNRYLELHKTREEVEEAAGVSQKPSEEPVKGNTKPQKFDAGKPRMDLIRPEFLMEIGRGLEYGSRKYQEERGEVPNYLKGRGFYYSKIIASTLRHFYAWAGGESVDKESGVHHLALAVVNIMFLFTYDISNSGIDDRVFLGDKENKD